MIPYQAGDPCSINVFFYCMREMQQRAFMVCPACKYYPCRQLTQTDVYMLNASPLMERVVTGWKKRRVHLVLIKTLSGEIKEAPEGFDIANPNVDTLRDVAEVYVISKELVPTITLRPKPREDRDRLRTPVHTPAYDEAEGERINPPKKRRKRNA
jgi:hypothetical protein